MLLKNDLIEYAAPTPRTVRILRIDSGGDTAYIFAMHTRSAMPERVSLRALVADIVEERARLTLNDPYACAPDLDALPAKHLALRDRAWRIIAGLPLDDLALYRPRTRGALILQHSADCGVSYPTLYRYLRRYWERGQQPNALLPDYCNSGAPGKTRASNAGVKRGRPRKSGLNSGLNADAAIRITFRAAVTRYNESHARFCRRAAYRQMIEEFFKEGDADALPSFGQFNYWIEKDACLKQDAAAQQIAPPSEAA